MKHLVIDVETTGLNPSSERMLELAVVDISRFCLSGVSPLPEKLRSKQFMLNPGIPILGEATKIHGISDRHVSEKPSFQDLASEIYDRLSDAVLIGHNIQFDIAFLTSEFSRVGIRFRPRKVCTLEMARTLLPTLESHKLEALNRHFGLSGGRAHRAAKDAKTTALLYFRLRALEAVAPEASATSGEPASIETTMPAAVHIAGLPTPSVLPSSSLFPNFRQF